MKRNWLQSLAALFRSTGAPDQQHANSSSHEMEAASGVLDTETIRDMMKGIATTRADELDCGGCFDQMDRFVELYLSGEDTARILPLVHDHLQRCPDCQEEYDALLRAIEAEN